MVSTRRVAIVGLGAISQTYVQALEELDNYEVIGGVDIAGRARSFRGRAIPLFDSVKDLSSCSPDEVIVATPSPTHANVLNELVELTSAHVLVEKPMVTSLYDLEQLYATGALNRIDVLFHAACAPEVEWAVDLVTNRRSELGILQRFESAFTDPYAVERFKDVTSGKANSWLDSGSNALSVLQRFVTLDEVTVYRELAEAVSTFHAQLAGVNSDGRPVVGSVFTSWDVTQPTKYTRLSFENAELILDHQAVAGRLVVDDNVTDVFTTDRNIDRMLLHYRNVFRRYLVEQTPVFSNDDVLRLHRLLLGVVSADDPDSA